MPRPLAVAAACAMATAVLAGSAALFATESGQPDGGGNRILLAEAVQDCHDSGGGVPCVEQAVGVSIERAGIPATARDLVVVLRGDESFGGICHEAMHWLGKQAARDYKDHVGELQGVFPACAFGLMHGLIESVSLPPEPDAAAREIRELCGLLMGGELEVQQGSREHFILTDCAHGSGHSLGYSHPGELEYGFQSCRQAFDMEDVLWACFNGVGMVNVDYAAQMLAALPQGQPVPVDTWERITEPVCGLMGEMRGRACSGAFVQVAADSGPQAEVGFLNWCQDRYPEMAFVCFQGLGTAVGVSGRAHEWPVEKVGEELLTVCAAARSDDLLVECWAGLAIGLTQRGLSNERAVSEACAVYQSMLRPELATRTCQKAQDQVVSSGSVMEVPF